MTTTLSANVPNGNCTAKVHPSRLLAYVAVEKWVPVNMEQYTGKDNSINAQIYFARPEECHSFLERGLLSVTEFIRHHNTLAYNGLWSWTDPDVEKVLQTTVGRKFFNYMGNLNMDNLNEMVAADLTKTEQYLDYPTECKLRRLLAREQDHGQQGKDAREQLRNYREFYSGWDNTLFRNLTLETEKSAPVATAAASSNSTQAVKATSAASYLKLDRLWWSLSGILLLML